MNLSPTTRIAIHPGLLTQMVYDEAVIVSPQNAMITSLNATGSFLFTLLQQGPLSLDALLQALVEEFEIDSSVAKADLHAFIAELHGHELVLLRPVDGSC